MIPGVEGILRRELQHVHRKVSPVELVARVANRLPEDVDPADARAAATRRRRGRATTTPPTPMGGPPSISPRRRPAATPGPTRVESSGWAARSRAGNCLSRREARGPTLTLTRRRMPDRSGASPRTTSTARRSLLLRLSPASTAARSSNSTRTPSRSSMATMSGPTWRRLTSRQRRLTGGTRSSTSSGYSESTGRCRLATFKTRYTPTTPNTGSPSGSCGRASLGTSRTSPASRSPDTGWGYAGDESVREPIGADP